MKTTYEVKINIGAVDIADLLITGLDPVPFPQAVGYWCKKTGYTKPPKIEFQRYEEQVYPYCDYPLNDGGAALFEIEGDNGDPDNGKKLVLDTEAIERGLQLMATTRPKEWADFLNDNADIETADCFLQLCLLGEIVYG